MPSAAYQLFLDSMVMDIDKWRDGIGYDLKTLEQLGPEERLSIEELLIDNLKQAGDWRDLEALFALGTTSARAAVDMARFHNNTKIRHYALRIALDAHHSKDTTKEVIAALEVLVIQAIEHGDFEIAERMPTMRVKKALLDLVREANSVIRVNAAAFLLYLCDQAPEPFDWSQRPFFLRFGTEDPKELQLAWEELRTRTGL